MTGGSCCTSKEPTTRDKPNTTHAPLRQTFTKTAKLVDTRIRPEAKQATKSQNDPQNTPGDAIETQLVNFIITMQT